MPCKGLFDEIVSTGFCNEPCDANKNLLDEREVICCSTQEKETRNLLEFQSGVFNGATSVSIPHA